MPALVFDLEPGTGKILRNLFHQMPSTFRKRFPKGDFMTPVRLCRPARGMIVVIRTLWFCFFLIVFAGTNSGCTRQEGTAVSSSSLTQVHEGVSTMADVRHWLGKPDEVRTLLGNQTWIYRHTVRKGWFSLRMKEREVRILFSHAGIVRKITVHETQDSQLF
jgi:outer membrane protein assembly factor BamE (lipoprotein component of BamABCDE complex)